VSEGLPAFVSSFTIPRARNEGVAPGSEGDDSSGDIRERWRTRHSRFSARFRVGRRRSREQALTFTLAGRRVGFQVSSWNAGMYEMPTIAPSGDCSLATV
jgi:hypothetical protein